MTGATVHRLRTELGLTVEELGLMASFAYGGISHIERFGAVPKLDNAIRLAGALGVDLDELTGGITWKASEEEGDGVGAPDSAAASASTSVPHSKGKRKRDHLHVGTAFLVQFSKNVKAARSSSRLSQASVAGRAGIDKNIVRQIERGEIQAKLDTLIRLVSGLDTTWDQLLSGMIWVPGTESSTRPVRGPRAGRSTDWPIGYFQIGLSGGGEYAVAAAPEPVLYMDEA